MKAVSDTLLLDWGVQPPDSHTANTVPRVIGSSRLKNSRIRGLTFLQQECKAVTMSEV